MKTLIVPDVHNHTEEVEEQVARYPADRVIFLGDYFDSIGDSPEMAADTARWLKDSMARPERLHLWGNHDLWYRFPDNPHVCWVGSGFTFEKLEAISSILTASDWAKLRLMHFVTDDILLSHAGVRESIFAHPIRGLEKSWLEEACLRAMDDAEAALDNPVLGEFGIVWLRWWEMTVLPEFSQVVGHTVDLSLRVDTEGERFNLCLDTMGRYLGWIEDDGVMQVIDDHRQTVVWRHDAVPREG